MELSKRIRDIIEKNNDTIDLSGECIHYTQLPLVVELLNKKSINTLILSRNNLDDRCFEPLSKIKFLETLDLSQNDIRGRNIDALVNIKYIDMSDNP